MPAEVDGLRCLRSSFTTTFIIPLDGRSTPGDRAFPAATQRAKHFASVITALNLRITSRQEAEDVFTARHYASAVYAVVVCLCV